MTKPEIINEKPISMAEIKDELEKAQKKKEKLNFRAERTIEYINQFTELSLKKSQELKEKIEKLKIPRLKDEHIIKIIDLMPETAEEIKSILSGYTVTVTNENMKKIAEIIKEHKKK